MHSARALLVHISQRLMPPPGKRHALTLPDDGDGLVLSVHIGTTVQLVHLDGADLLKEPGAVADEIVAFCSAQTAHV